jgi:tubulin polyglutamylase TTLL11
MEKQDVDKEEKSEKLAKLKINTHKCRGELQILKLIIKKNKWDEVYDEKADIFWSGLNLLTDEFPLGFKTRINRIPGMTGLAHKKNTAYYLNKFQEFFPDRYHFFPRTFIIPEQLSEFKKYITKEKQICIAKPTAGSQGDGIYIIRNYRELPFVKNGFIENRDYVVQTYLDKPLLIDKKKFDLRLYVLISSVNPFIAYLNSEGLARFCTEDYQAPNDSNILNNFIHLSNYSLNKNNNNYNFMNDPSTVSEINEGSKRTLTSFWKTMEKNRCSKEVIMPKIEDLVIKFLTSIYPFILYNYNCMFGKKEAKCFHIIGFDIIIDEDQNPFLLEINANPSLSIVYDPHENDKKEELKKKEISYVDLFVKEKVIEDCIKIVSKKIEEQMTIGKGNYFNTYKMLIDGELNDLSDMSIFTKMLDIFGYLSGFKFNDSLNSSKFSKLGSLPYMNDYSLDRNSLDILFKQIVKNGINMDFYLFIQAIEEIAARIDKNLYTEDKFSCINNIVNNIHNQIHF